MLSRSSSPEPWRAAPPEQPDQRGQIAETHDSVTAAVLEDLAMRVEKHCRGSSIAGKEAAKSEVSSWLERTPWPTYLDGYALPRAADPARPIDAITEPAWYVLACSVDRLAEAAYSTVCGDAVNGFKRDYDVAGNVSNDQTAHNAWTVGHLYARGLEERRGHVEARRLEFRGISREWHKSLGFAPYFPSRKRPLADDMQTLTTKRQRRADLWEWNHAL